MEYQALRRALRVLTQSLAKESPARSVRAAERAVEQNRNWLSNEHIQGFGIAERITGKMKKSDLALKVYVDEKMSLSERRYPVPHEVSLKGVLSQPVPLDVEAIGKVKLHFDPIRYRTRPAIPGSSAAHPGVLGGTMGCLVNRDKDESLYILSTCHSMALSGLAQVGDAVIQPSIQDQGNAPGDQIATLTEWIQPRTTPTGFPNLVDAAIARVVQAGSVTSDIHVIGQPVGIGQVRRGGLVHKIGRTTSYTLGMVLDADFTFETTWLQQGGPNARVGFGDQVLCTHYATEGESGSLVLNRSNRALGLHVGGTEWRSFFCKIRNVLTALNCALLTTPV